MRNFTWIIVITFLITSCRNNNEGTHSPHQENFDKRTVTLKASDSLESGKTYLSVYSQIYSISQHKTLNLTVTASIKNISLKDTIYVTRAEYYDTHATPIRTYFDKPIFVAPMETIEIVIDEVDIEGGTGANFIFDWKIKPNSLEPYFEGIMISTLGQVGLSFTTQGKRIE